MSKKYVSLWSLESKTGDRYLAGTDKATGFRYFIFRKEGDDGKVSRRLLVSKSQGDDLELLGFLDEKEYDGRVYYTVKNGMKVNENQFFDAEDPFIKNREGSYVLNKDGEKIPSPTHTLTIGA